METDGVEKKRHTVGYVVAVVIFAAVLFVYFGLIDREIEEGATPEEILERMSERSDEQMSLKKRAEINRKMQEVSNEEISEERQEEIINRMEKRSTNETTKDD